MPRGKVKTRWQIINSPLVCKAEIKRLLNYTDGEANIAFRLAQEHDIQNAGGYDRLISKTKVTVESVLLVAGKSYELLKEQIKNADGLAHQSAES